MNEYQSFTNSELPAIDYDCQNLQTRGFLLKVRCNKQNPDCQAFIKKQKNKGHLVEVVELDASKHVNDMVDIWRKITLTQSN